MGSLQGGPCQPPLQMRKLSLQEDTQQGAPWCWAGRRVSQAAWREAWRQEGAQLAPPPALASVSHLQSEGLKRQSRYLQLYPKEGSLGWGPVFECRSATDSHWPLGASVYPSIQLVGRASCGLAPCTRVWPCNLSRPLLRSARCPQRSRGREQSVRLLPRAPGGRLPARPPHIAGIPGLASWDPTLVRNQAV